MTLNPHREHRCVDQAIFWIEFEGITVQEDDGLVFPWPFIRVPDFWHFLQDRPGAWGSIGTDRTYHTACLCLQGNFTSSNYLSDEQEPARKVKNYTALVSCTPSASFYIQKLNETQISRKQKRNNAQKEGQKQKQHRMNRWQVNQGPLLHFGVHRLTCVSESYSDDCIYQDLP